MSAHESALAGLTEHANALRDAPIPEEVWALVANHLRSIEIDLAKKRLEVQDQASAVAQAARDAEPLGKKLVYESDRGALVEKTIRRRSFNSSGIFAAVMNAGEFTVGEALQALTGANAVELGWKISFLENVADKYGFDLPTTHHEIEDGDPEYLVGVVSTSKMERA